MALSGQLAQPPRPEVESAPAMPDGSAIVEHTLRTARRLVALAIGAVGLVLAMVALERAWFLRSHDQASDRVERARAAASGMLLNDERLTMSAFMAAATGEERWTARYHRHLPELESALAAGEALAPTEVARRFHEQTRTATNQLIELETTALEAVAVGAPGVARAILDGERYRRDKDLLAAGTNEFLRSTVAATRDAQAALRQRAQWLLVGVVALALALGWATWRHLGRSLARSRAVLVEAQNRFQHLAVSDALTGLPNRAAMHEGMGAATARARRSGERLALLMIDLDNFKPVNDRHGHHTGDRVLREAAQRMQSVLRQGEMLARFGGDEFVALIDEPDAEGGSAWRVAERLIEALTQPIHADNLTLHIGASIGIARFPDDADQASDLLRRADLALYRAKNGGRRRACHYDPALDNAMAEREALEQRLREAIDTGQIVPHYQPVVDLPERRVRGVELLSRWQDPQRGLVPPSEFIALAENCGLIGPLTLAVLRQACTDLRAMPAHWRLAFNVAPQQLQDPRLVGDVMQVLRSTGTDPRRIEVEVTETALVADFPVARKTIEALKREGITVALDDFGTGYSSLNTLSQLGFDKIKIDRSFVATLHERSESAKIVASIIGLGASLGVQVLAEGVETERDARTLSGLGCGAAQGYLFARPLALTELLRRFAGAGTVAA
jgi:diguanylate cyclase (GGDEF)-like protein